MEADDHFAALAGVLVHTGQELLKRQRGEFIPFGAFINAEGRPEMVNADLGVERPNSTELIEFLRGALRKMAEELAIQACGICVNVGARLPGYENKVDAICCFLEGKAQDPMNLFVPYRADFFGRRRFDKAIGLPGESLVFPRQ
ncbi:MAG TPA: hypothetical protein VFG04_28785 [Planctomycetaceae bacterium]|nr:hypothetical protein [Planctomycetaceae bacterium]